MKKLVLLSVLKDGNLGRKPNINNDIRRSQQREVMLGMKFWTNGVDVIRAKEQPGPEWKNGRTKSSK